MHAILASQEAPSPGHCTATEDAITCIDKGITSEPFAVSCNILNHNL